MRRHEVHLFPLACGLVLAAVAAAGLAGHHADARWLLPAVLAILGALGVAAAARAALAGGSHPAAQLPGGDARTSQPTSAYPREP